MSDSLVAKGRLSTALAERPDLVRQPANLVQRLSSEGFHLAAPLGIIDVFAEMSESMLLLGEPGAGKTTQLLELASALLARSRANRARGTDEDVSLPVVLDLSDWKEPRAKRPFTHFGSKRQTFTGWLLSAIRDRYRIPEPIGQRWLREDRFILLLDGLDEVVESDREGCVKEINAMQGNGNTARVAVASRPAAYERLPTRLYLQGAVTIRPMTKEQIIGFLNTVSPELRSFIEALGDDSQLWELLTTPLMLKIVTMAHNRGIELALGSNSDWERRRRLLDAYVVEMLARRRTHEPKSGPEGTLNALRILASVTERLKAGTRIIPLPFDPSAETMPEAVISYQRACWFYSAVAATSIATGIAVTIRFNTAAGLVVALLLWGNGLVWLAGAKGDVAGFAPLTAARLPLVLGWLGVWGIGVFLAISILEWFALALSHIPWAPSGDWLAAVAIGFASSLGGTAVLADVANGIQPWTNGTSTVRFVRRQVILYSILIITVPFVVGKWSNHAFWVPIGGWGIGYFLGILPGAFVCMALTGPLIRLTLVSSGMPDPWRRSFLRLAVDRSLLASVDTEYHFVHLLLRDHLANCYPAALAVSVSKRRHELDESLSGQV